MQAADDRDQIWTDFSRYPHEALIRALSVSNPAELVAAGDAWALTAAALYERAGDVAEHGSRMAVSWTGAAAGNYRTMLTELVDGTRRVAAAAATARDLVYAAAEALAAAWTSMPPVSGEAARRQAVLIMAELAERYLEVAGALNETMSRLVPGAVDPGVRPGEAVALPPADLIFGDPARPPAPGQEPLFGRMLPAGMAAAGAVLGRPFLPSLLAGGRPIPPAGTPAPVVTEPPAPAVTEPPAPAVEEPPASEVVEEPPVLDEPLPGGGLGSLPGGGLGPMGGGGLGPLPDLDTGQAPAGQPTPAESTGIAAATGGGGASTRSGLPMMPMMPMGMMGAGGEGGTGRRLPPWLVETDNVWGEASAVTSPVIGEDVAGGSWW